MNACLAASRRAGFYHEAVSLVQSVSVHVFSRPDLVPAVYLVCDVLRRKMTPLFLSLSLFRVCQYGFLQPVVTQAINSDEF
jgi:hypothetical protein